MTDAALGDRAQLAVDIRLLRANHAQRLCRGQVYVGPVQAGTREQPDLPAIGAGVHSVSIEFDLMCPLVALWHSLREL
jgi:hypothetical protein